MNSTDNQSSPGRKRLKSALIVLLAPAAETQVVVEIDERNLAQRRFRSILGPLHALLGTGVRAGAALPSDSAARYTRLICA